MSQTPPPLGTKFIQIAAGDRHSLGLLDTGEVLAWGCNEDGQCDIPDLLPGMRFIQISAGNYCSMGLLYNPENTSSEVIVWGDNEYGQCNVPKEPFLIPSTGRMTKSARKS